MKMKKKKKAIKTDVSSQYTKYQSLQLETAAQNWERRALAVLSGVIPSYFTILKILKFE